jgi:DNA-binding FadR family transcriptional regulator
VSRRGADVVELAAPAIDESIFAPVRSQTAFEETVERLGTAIKLGLLPPATQLPAERELCAMLGISRSTLRQALTALADSGQLHAVRGRGGGTFVSDTVGIAEPPSAELIDRWREVCDARLAVETGISVLAAMRASEEALDGLDALVVEMDARAGEFVAFRQADVLFHVGLAESTRNPQLVASMTATQGEMTHLISFIPHPASVLRSSNDQHRRLVRALRERDAVAAAEVMAEHAQATEHVLAGLLPKN